ncbi:hypothetical protein SynPROSU1_02574 [Synechococcus sp. PROS-U-1]|nr:hypothetical protein SynPROSU1_02574 [Synechococcus sp. PROS-U-1]
MLDAEHNLLQAQKIKRLSDGTLKRGSNTLGLASGSLAFTTPNASMQAT